MLNVVQGYGEPQAMRWFVIMTYVPCRSPAYGHRAQHHEKRRAEKILHGTGGKSPVLIFEDADIERALDAPCSPSSRSTANAAPPVRASYSAKHLPGIRKTFCRTRQPSRVGDPNDPNTQVGALISQQPGKKSLAISVSALKKAQPCWGRPG